MQKIKEITIKSSKEIEVIEKAINYLNSHLFEGALGRIKVTIQPDSAKQSTYGWAVCSVWTNGKANAHELNITANSLKRPFQEIWITLVHELIHIYAFSEGDEQGACSRQGRYHGRKFKELCDKFFLITEKNEQIGYITPHQKMLKEQREIYSEFKKQCKVNLAQLFKYQRITFEKPEKEPKPKTTSKYQCFHCGIEFTAKKGLQLICACCEEHIEELG